MKYAYLKLVRFDKPAGTLLLWLPTAWALWIANQGRPPFFLVLLFFLGTFLMRSAGCVINDLADRHIDFHVKRTQLRPLAKGEVSSQEALLITALLLFCALLILLQLPKLCFFYALLAMLITVLYPFCKRFFQAPQLILGIAFSMGIPMAFAASHTEFNRAMIYLLLINFLWIIAYDTQYAMADREDDLRIGVKSTAILFAKRDRFIIGILQIVFHGLWLMWASQSGYSPFFLGAWSLAGIILFYQQQLLAQGKEENYLQAFASNSYYGLLMWLAIAANFI